MRVVAEVLLALLCVSGVAKGDTVTFKNGDKLAGTFVNVRSGVLALKSDVLGDVSIPLDKVQSFAAAKPAVIISTDKKIIRGQVELDPSGSWQVTANGTSQTVSAANVNVILLEDAYHNEVEVPAKPWQEWKGSANFGYAIQHGDQQTHNLSTIVVATRERPTDLLFMPHFRTNYGLTLLFSKAQQDGSAVTSNTISTNLREDYLLSPANFVFAMVQLDHVDAQSLYLQQTFGGGFGRDLIHTKRTLLSALGGVNYLHQRFEGGTESKSVEGMVGEKLGVQIASWIRLDHHFNFYPNFQYGGQYHYDTAANVALKINRRLSANAGLIDLYITNPPVGAHNNNVAVTTGLGYTF